MTQVESSPSLSFTEISDSSRLTVTTAGEGEGEGEGEGVKNSGIQCLSKLIIIGV